MGERASDRASGQEVERASRRAGKRDRRASERAGGRLSNWERKSMENRNNLKKVRKYLNVASL